MLKEFQDLIQVNISKKIKQKRCAIFQDILMTRVFKSLQSGSTWSYIFSGRQSLSFIWKNDRVGNKFNTIRKKMDFT